jgi:hypothetical protein
MGCLWIPGCYNMGTYSSHLCAHPTAQLKLTSLCALCRLCVGTMISIQVIVTTTHLCLPLFLPSPLWLHDVGVEVPVSLATWFTGIITPERTSSTITTSAWIPCIHPTCFVEVNNYILVLLSFALTVSFILYLLHFIGSAWVGRCSSALWKDCNTRIVILLNGSTRLAWPDSNHFKKYVQQCGSLLTAYLLMS